MIPFSPPDIYQEIIDEVTEVLRSGWITTGPKTKEFERKISEYTGCSSTLCVNSATAGLELALRWYGVGPGDEVIVPAYTYCASANVVLHCGAKVVMADVGIDFNIDVASLKNKITERTKAIIPVDFAGYPADYDEILSLVREPSVKSKFIVSGKQQEKLGRILVLSDSAHSFGAVYKGKKAGLLADISVFSFHAVKNLTTAEGGALCLNIPEIDSATWYADLSIKSLHGQNKDALAKTKIGNWKYDVLEAGFKWNMTDIQAAIGLISLKNYNHRTLKRRKEIFEKYQQSFGLEKWSQLPEFHNAVKTSSYHLYPLRIKGITEEKRDAIIQTIFERGVSVNVHFPPLPMLTVYKNLGYQIKDYPVTYDNYSREISLPVYYNLTDDLLDKVIETVKISVSENL